LPAAYSSSATCGMEAVERVINMMLAMLCWHSSAARLQSVTQFLTAPNTHLQNTVLTLIGIFMHPHLGLLCSSDSTGVGLSNRPQASQEDDDMLDLSRYNMRTKQPCSSDG
jgi:hypothetical protein